MKIGIMGGTFDPIHNGHLMLGKYAYKEYQLDEIWFMPNGNPPHKSMERIGSQVSDRVEMVKRAIEGTKYFTLQMYEAENPNIHYSYETIRYFKHAYPENEYYFIMGADSLFSMETWVHPEIFLKECVILAAYRDEAGTTEMLSQIQYLNKKYDADIRLLHTPNVDVSSSEIRKKIREGQSVGKDIPESVMKYIETKQLYKD